MKQSPWRIVALVSLITISHLVTAGPLYAQDARKNKWLGLYGENYLGDLSVTTANLGINLGNIARLHGGYGSNTFFSKGYSLNVATGGLKLFVPSMDLSPFVGGGYMLIMAKIENISVSAGVPVVNAGFDWSTPIGFNIGATVIYIVITPATTGASAYMGWYF